MYLRELRKIARPHWFDILFAVKRSTGLSVTTLAKALKMSYMGIKQHCDDLEKLGYLDTWRKPRKKGSSGRPEKLYRLTERANVFFPSLDNELTTDLLGSMREAYGSNAPEKLLFSYLANKARNYAAAISGTTFPERATSFVTLRNREGYLCVFEEADAAEARPAQIVEYHSPLQEIFRKYPATLRMEQNLLEQALQFPVTRQVEEVSGLTQTIIQAATSANRRS